MTRCVEFRDNANASQTRFGDNSGDVLLAVHVVRGIGSLQVYIETSYYYGNRPFFHSFTQSFVQSFIQPIIYQMKRLEAILLYKFLLLSSRVYKALLFADRTMVSLPVA